MSRPSRQPRPTQPGSLIDNAERVNDEWNDLLGAVERLHNKGFPISYDENLIRAKLSKLEHYAKHSESVGALKD